MLCNTLLCLIIIWTKTFSFFLLSTVYILTWWYVNAVISGWWRLNMSNKAVQCDQQSIPPPPTVSSPVIWTKGKVNLPIPRNSAKPQITLLHLGLRPIGKGALVVTGGPVGTGADGRFRRLEVGLCIMWLAVAVTVSLLSLPLRGSDPHRPLICGLGLVSPPFPSRNRPSLVNYGIGNVKGDSVAFPPAFISTNCKVHVKKPSF